MGEPHAVRHGRGAPAGVPRRAALFAETNLGTCVRGRDGRDGLWFLSVERACPVLLAARAIGAPYHLGRLHLSRSRDGATYTGSRGRGAPSCRVSIRPGEPIRPTCRDVRLTSRWRAFTRGFGWETPVEHEPWPLRAARRDTLEDALVRAAGLPPPAEEPLAHFARSQSEPCLEMCPCRTVRFEPRTVGASPAQAAGRGRR